jgi:hypothetical protein
MIDQYRNVAIEVAISLAVNPFDILTFEDITISPDRVIQMLTAMHSLMAKSRELTIEVLKQDPDVFPGTLSVVINPDGLMNRKGDDEQTEATDHD